MSADELFVDVGIAGACAGLKVSFDPVRGCYVYEYVAYSSATSAAEPNAASAADPNAAMIARDDTDDARNYAKRRVTLQKCLDLAAARAAKQPTALPANAALTRLHAGSHLFGSVRY